MKEGTRRVKGRALFLFFGAAGEPAVRVAKKVIIQKAGPFGKVYGAPISYTTRDKAKHYVKIPEGTIQIELELHNETQSCHCWIPLQEVIPLNKVAIKLMAQLIWERDLPHYKEWRSGYSARRFPSLGWLRKKITDFDPRKYP